MSNCFAW